MLRDVVVVGRKIVLQTQKNAQKVLSAIGKGLLTSIRNVKFYIKMRCNTMLITAVCVIFLIKEIPLTYTRTKISNYKNITRNSLLCEPATFCCIFGLEKVNFPRMKTVPNLICEFLITMLNHKQFLLLMFLIFFYLFVEFAEVLILKGKSDAYK